MEIVVSLRFLSLSSFSIDFDNLWPKKRFLFSKSLKLQWILIFEMVVFLRVNVIFLNRFDNVCPEKAFLL